VEDIHEVRECRIGKDQAHPATTEAAARMMPGSFFIGIGSGEHLTDPFTGERRPPVDIRQGMAHDSRLRSGRQ
jgi:hypothetical protein